METHSIAIPVSEPSQVGHARRLAVDVMSRLGRSETEVGHAAIVVTELANNLLLHGGGGRMLIRPLGATGLEALAMDQGRGMWNVGRCLEDGYSTGGTAGTGLGAVQRLSSVFDVFSQQGAGTVVLAQIGAGSTGSLPAFLQVGVVSAPKAREEVCGDAWDVVEDSLYAMATVADGLGHGASASTASQAAIRIVRANARQSPEEVLDLAHSALRSTRGAALAIAVLDSERQEIRYAGVGNIAAVVYQPDGTSRSLVSHNGTVGHQIRKIQVFTNAWPPGAMLVMHSDGLGTQWSLNNYPGLFQRHAGLIAGVLYRDFVRERDDVTVLVIKAPGDTGPARLDASAHD